jgi:hypothetical protein
MVKGEVMLVKGNIGTHIFGATLGRVFNATPRPLCPWKELRYPSCRKMFGPNGQYRWAWRINNVLAPTVFRTQNRSARSLRAEYALPPLPNFIAEK